MIYPPTVKWLLYPDDEDEPESQDNKISGDGLSIKFSESDQKKDTVMKASSQDPERFIDLTTDDFPKKILKKRSQQERENAELSDECESPTKRKFEHSFVPNIS